MVDDMSESVLHRAIAEGVVRFLRSDPVDQACVCCPPGTGHIFSRGVEFAFPSDYPEHFRRDARLFVAMNASDRNAFEGKRVRLTVEVIDEEAAADVEPLHVGESSFEGWFASYNPAGKGDKQRARDAYAAGMGDPLVRPAECKPLLSISDLCARCLRDAVLTPKGECTNHGANDAAVAPNDGGKNG